MDVEITSTKENKLLDRKEIDAVVYYKGATPNRKDLKQSVCGKIGANPDLVVLREVKSEYGVQRVGISAHVYQNAESMKKIEPVHILVRESMVEKPAKKAKAPKAAPKKDEKK